jgi:branched-chain amino acid transport system permease protein
MRQSKGGPQAKISMKGDHARNAGSQLGAWSKVPTFAGLGLLVLAIVSYLLPLELSSYQTFEFTQVFIYAIALLGLNILIGYNGQFSLGHGAFYAIGAYTTAIMTTRWGIPYGWAIITAGVLSLIVGFLFGLPALRFEGLYLALATFALALATPQVLKYFDSWTGGSQGIVLDKPAVPLSLPINADQYLYYLSLTVLILALVLARNLLRGRVGRAIMAIRDNPIAAEAMGVNSALYKSLTFGVSAMYTGIAGALGALTVAFVAPDTFNAFLSINFLVGSVVGGVASISGAIFGSAFIEFVPIYAQEVSRAAPWAIFGVTLIIFMYVMPTGVAGLVRRAAAMLARLRAGEQPAPSAQIAAAQASESAHSPARAALGKPD